MNTGKRFDLGESPDVPGRVTLGVNFLRAPSFGSLIQFYQGGKGHTYAYKSGMSAPVRMNDAYGSFAYLYVGDDGSHIYLNEPNAQTVLGIFHATPGQQPRLLTPNRAFSLP